MRSLLAALLFWVAACAHPLTQTQLTGDPQTMASFEPEDSKFISFDGAELGLTVWPSTTSEEPEMVILGVHGMNDYADAFHLAAPWFAEHGVTTYAYDQRGFGRSPNFGIWPDEELMREDFRTAVKLTRARHPDAILTVVGISMGGAMSMTAFASDDPPVGVDRLVLSGPGLRGWGALPKLWRASLWLSTHVRPNWVVVPPKGVKIEPSDNVEMLRRAWADPLKQKSNRIDQVYGVITLMEHAHEAAPNMPASLPTLLTYGARDIVVPPRGLKRTGPILPPHVRTAYYEKGYHMLLRDLQAETVYADMLAFMKDPSAQLPSGASPLPWLAENAH